MKLGRTTFGIGILSSIFACAFYMEGDKSFAALFIIWAVVEFFISGLNEW